MNKLKTLTSKEKNDIYLWFNKIDELVATKKAQTVIQNQLKSNKTQKAEV